MTGKMLAALEKKSMMTLDLINLVSSPFNSHGPIYF